VRIDANDSVIWELWRSEYI